MASGFLVNPSPPDLWRTNAVLNGKSRRHFVAPVEGTLSIKTVLSGEAVWETSEHRHRLDPDSFLILNDGAPYSLSIDSETSVETFCVFFRPGMIQDARSEVLAPQIDAVQGLGFYERKRLKSPKLSRTLANMKSLMDEGAMAGLEADDVLSEVVGELLLEEEIARNELTSLAYSSFATRLEVFRLLNTARDFILSNVHRPLQLEEIAAVACLSPFHFHRLHRQAFRETPHDFVTRARLARAQRMLLKGHEVGEVALELGFESVPTFIRLFKKHLGVTPGAFRKIG